MTKKIKWNKTDLNNGDRTGATNKNNISGTNTPITQGYQHGSLTKGLVAYYPMERGKGQIIRDAAQNKIVQIKRASWSSDSEIGSNSLNFNGSEDYAELNSYINPSDPVASGSTDSISLAFWLRPNSGTGTSCIVEWRDSGSGRLHVWQHSNEGDFYINPAGSMSSESAEGEINLDQWSHYVVVCDTTNQEKRWYVNGLEVKSSSDDGVPDTSGDLFRIGRRPDDDRVLDGYLQELRVYDRVLSKPEIRALYNLSQPNGVKVAESDVPSQQDGGVSRWRFNDDSGADTATDSWGDNDGDITGAVYTTERVYGSKAMSFDGGSSQDDTDFIDFGDKEDFRLTQNFAISFWMKPTQDIGDWQAVIDKRRGDTWEGYVIQWNSTGTPLRLHSSATEDFNSNYKPWNCLNEWTHVILSNYQGKYRFYINGNLDSEHEDGPLDPSTVPLLVAKSNYQYEPYWGNIDDFRIYNRGLNPIEAEKLFKKGSHRINRGDTLQ